MFKAIFLATVISAAVFGLDCSDLKRMQEAAYVKFQFLQNNFLTPEAVRGELAAGRRGNRPTERARQILELMREAQDALDQFNALKIQCNLADAYALFLEGEERLNEWLRQVELSPFDYELSSRSAKVKAAYELATYRYRDFFTQADWEVRRDVRYFVWELLEYNQYVGELIQTLRRTDSTPNPLTQRFESFVRRWIEDYTDKARKMTEDPKSDLFGYLAAGFSKLFALEGQWIRFHDRAGVLKQSPPNPERLRLFVLPHSARMIDAAIVSQLNFPKSIVLTSVTTWGKDMGLSEEQIKALHVHSQILVVSNDDPAALLRLRTMIKNGEVENIILLPEGNLPTGFAYESRPFIESSIMGVYRMAAMSRKSLDIVVVSSPEGFRMFMETGKRVPGDSRIIDVYFEPVIHPEETDQLAALTLDSRGRPVKSNRALDTLVRQMHLSAMQGRHTERIAGTLRHEINGDQLFRALYFGTAECRALIEEGIIPDIRLSDVWY